MALFSSNVSCFFPFELIILIIAPNSIEKMRKINNFIIFSEYLIVLTTAEPFSQNFRGFVSSPVIVVLFVFIRYVPVNQKP